MQSACAELMWVACHHGHTHGHTHGEKDNDTDFPSFSLPFISQRLIGGEGWESERLKRPGRINRIMKAT